MKLSQSMLPPFGLSLLLGLAYARTLAPGLTWANGGADGGDLITAVATGGVPHPGGYPLYVIVARLFQFLPLGTLAFRTNLMSAVVTLASALLVYFLLARLLQARPFGRAAACFAALAFGLAPLVWSQAVITEVYSLQSLLVLLFLFALFQEAPPGGDWGRGLLFGLAVGGHLTTLLLLPLLLLESPRGNKNALFTGCSVLARRLGGVLGGLLVYIVLPLRALSGAPVNWGNPVTPQAFFWLVSGWLYGVNLLGLSAADVLQRIQGEAGLLLHQFTLPGTAIGLYGLLSSRLPRQATLASLWMFLSVSIFSALYSTYDSQVYFSPACIAFALWLGVGAQDLLNTAARSVPRLGRVLAILLLVSVPLRALWTLPDVDASADTRAEVFGGQVLAAAPPNAIVFTSNDQETFALWYFHYALGQRPDLVIVVEGLLSFDWYLHTLAITYPAFTIPPKNGMMPFDLILENPARPVCFVEYQPDSSAGCR